MIIKVYYSVKFLGNTFYRAVKTINKKKKKKMESLQCIIERCGYLIKMVRLRRQGFRRVIAARVPTVRRTAVVVVVVADRVKARVVAVDVASVIVVGVGGKRPCRNRQDRRRCFARTADRRPFKRDEPGTGRSQCGFGRPLLDTRTTRRRAIGRTAGRRVGRYSARTAGFAVYGGGRRRYEIVVELDDGKQPSDARRVFARAGFPVKRRVDGLGATAEVGRRLAVRRPFFASRAIVVKRLVDGEQIAGMPGGRTYVRQVFAGGGAGRTAIPVRCPMRGDFRDRTVTAFGGRFVVRRRSFRIASHRIVVVIDEPSAVAALLLPFRAVVPQSDRQRVPRVRYPFVVLPYQPIPRHLFGSHSARAPDWVQSEIMCCCDNGAHVYDEQNTSNECNRRSNKLFTTGEGGYTRKLTKEWRRTRMAKLRGNPITWLACDQVETTRRILLFVFEQTRPARGYFKSKFVFLITKLPHTDVPSRLSADRPNDTGCSTTIVHT